MKNTASQVVTRVEIILIILSLIIFKCSISNHDFVVVVALAVDTF